MTSFSKAGRDAETRWEVVERLRGATLVSAWPKTGRTHQIRVHFSENGFPVLADKVYGAKKPPSKFRDLRSFNKKARPSREKPRIYSPGYAKTIEFSAEIPEDMVSAINFLRRKNG